MAKMRIKAQMLLMMLTYYDITSADTMAQSKILTRTNNFNTSEDTNGTSGYKNIQYIISGIIDLENSSTVLENKTKGTNFQNNKFERENLFIHTNKSVTDGFTTLESKIQATDFEGRTIGRGSRVLSQNDIIVASVASDPIFAINKSRFSIPNSDTSQMFEFHEKLSKPARGSKILPLTSGVHDVSNSLLETNVGNEEFLDLDLNKLSMENLQKLNTATKLSDYASLFGLDVFVEDIEIDDKNTFNGTSTADDASSSLGRRDRILQAYDSENDIVSGEFASCQPELQTVVLNEEIGSLYLPGCVRLRRCGGCCMGSDLLECRPTKTEPVKIKVLKVDQKSSQASLSQSTSRNNRGRGRGRAIRSRSRPRRNSAKLHIVHEWQHTSCACQCIKQAHHCHPVLQDYIPNECACVCKNRSEEKLCYSHSSSHIWDKVSCSCKCRRIRECSTGEIFDTKSCRCSMPPKAVLPDGIYHY